MELLEYYEPVYLRYPLLVRDKKKVLEEARRRKIELGDWFVSPLHPNLTGWEKIGYRKGTCPIAEDLPAYHQPHLLMEAIHLRDFIPDVGWLYKFSAVFHELIGLIWYSLRGLLWGEPSHSV